MKKNISLDSMEKFLSYASNDISLSIGFEMHVISLPMIFLFLYYSYHMNQRRPKFLGILFRWCVYVLEEYLTKN